MIYVTSDLHFGHDKFFCYIPRGFTSIEEMNNTIVKNWNEVVTNDDDVYILGDLMLNDNTIGMELLESLNGRLHVILGNHDTDTRRDLYEDSDKVVEVCGYATVIRYKKYNFYLSHYPALTSNHDNNLPLRARVINLCGHSHTEDKFADMDKGLIYHCEMDAHNCTPVSLDEIIWDIKNYLLHQEACSMAIVDAVNAVGTPRAEDTINIQAAVFKHPDVDAYCRDCINKLECSGPNMDGCPSGKEYQPPRCHKCVYNPWNCNDCDKYGKCKTYHRDPPDGGFYG